MCAAGHNWGNHDQAEPSPIRRSRRSIVSHHRRQASLQNLLPRSTVLSDSPRFPQLCSCKIWRSDSGLRVDAHAHSSRCSASGRKIHLRLHARFQEVHVHKNPTADRTRWTPTLAQCASKQRAGRAAPGFQAMGRPLRCGFRQKRAFHGTNYRVHASQSGTSEVGDSCRGLAVLKLSDLHDGCSDRVGCGNRLVQVLKDCLRIPHEFEVQVCAQQTERQDGSPDAGGWSHLNFLRSV